MVMALGHDGPRAYRPKGDGNLGGTPPDYPGLDENACERQWKLHAFFGGFASELPHSGIRLQWRTRERERPLASPSSHSPRPTEYGACAFSGPRHT